MTRLKGGLLAAVLVVGVAFPALAVAGSQTPLRGASTRSPERLPARRR
jgi:hypothetical protein